MDSRTLPWTKKEQTDSLNPGRSGGKTEGRLRPSDLACNVLDDGMESLRVNTAAAALCILRLKMWFEFDWKSW